jgi:hypothetical protein
VAAGIYLPEKQREIFFFCPFSHLSQQFLVAENLGMRTSTVEKKLFMNNGTFQIHLVSETFFSFSPQPII